MSRSPHEPKILASKPVCEPLTFVGALEGTTVGFTDGCELGTWGTHCTRPAQRRQTQVERMHGFGLSAAQDQNSKDGFLTWVGLSVEGAMVGACQAARHNRVSRAVRGGDMAHKSLGGWVVTVGRRVGLWLGLEVGVWGTSNTRLGQTAACLPALLLPCLPLILQTDVWHGSLLAQWLACWLTLLGAGVGSAVGDMVGVELGTCNIPARRYHSKYSMICRSSVRRSGRPRTLVG